jgi:plastocyanin
VMRSTGLFVSMMLAAAANLPAQARPAAAPAGPATHAVPGHIVRVRMQQTGTHYSFEPANVTVKQGDIVEFVNVSGFPHNVGFEAAKIPAGAADVLNRNMAQKVSSLLGPMMTAPNQAYRVSFAGAPVGTYAFYCLPHKAMGMTGVVTVQAATPRR